MTLSQWIELYGTRETITPKDPEKCLNELRAALDTGGVCFYGAGAVARTFLSIFESLHISVKALFDQDPSKQIEGYSVYTPDKIQDMVQENDILIATVNWRNQELVREYFRAKGIKQDLWDGSAMHSPMQRSLCALKNRNKESIPYEECPNCFIERNYCDLLKDNILINKPDVVLNKGGSKLPLIGVICGNICTLRCNHCVECVPHSKIDRHFEPADKLLKEIKRVAKAIEFVTVVDFVGGEPFLHPKLATLINEIRKLPNIGLINVFTNGTISPNTDLIQALKQDFITVNISDYSKNLTTDMVQRIDDTIKVLEREGISFTRVKDMTWYDMSSFEPNNDSEDELRKRFHACRINSCHRLYDNKLFRCLHLYEGYVTGKLEMDDTVIDISAIPDEQLPRKLDEFWEQPYSSGCKYCELPYISKLVPSGEQVKE